MSKLRVHDMAGEFGISADEVIALLRQMDVPVRSHLSLLTDDQVSRIRARWEREKRVRAEKAQPAPAAAPRRRRTGAAAAPDAPIPVVEAEAPAPAVRRRRAAEVDVHALDAHAGDVPAGDVPHADTHHAEAPREEDAHPVEAKAEVTPPSVAAPVEAPVEPAPEVRADIEHVSVERAAELKAAAAAEPAPVQAEAPVVEVAAAKPKPKPVAFERRDAAPAQRPAPLSTPQPAPVAERPAVVTPAAAAVSATPTAATPVASDAPAAPSAPLPADRPRPRPVVPGAPRPGRMGGSPNFGGARPIASAAPGGGLGQGQRRDDRRPGGPQGGQGGAPGGQGGQPGQGTQGTGMAASAQSQQRRGKKGKRGAVDQEAVSANITKTMTAMRGAGTRGRGGRRFGADMRAEMEEQRVAAVEKERKTVRVNEFITVSELAKILGVSATQIVGFAFKTLGLMVTINQRLDFDQIELIAGEFGFQAVKESDYAADLQEEQVIDAPEDLRPRPPVVTIMGHVDHGKTSLLDYIRKANVVAGEAGGITQHIGAYHVEVANKRLITFLDTPGHEAFTAMRARGAQVTDIVVIVIAADDQVMPQTVEAISHAKSAGVPIIIAINKVDLPTAQIAKVKQDLLQHEVVLEEFGGTVLHSEISAKKGTGVDELLDQILLQADILELKANPSRRAVGSVVEAQLDQGKGPVATVLVQNGTLKVGDDYICGIYSGRVRAMLDERGKPVKSAGPAIPVQILGLSGVPMAGDQLLVVEDASEARDIAQRRERLDREAKSRRSTRGLVSLEDFMSQTSAGQKRSLRLVIKADQGGPAEALADALGQLSNPEVQVEILHRGVGAIAETDILLAKASGAIIIGFHVRPDNNARAAAEREGVDIKLYRIIYEAVADVKAALEGMLRPESREVVYGEAEVRETFKVARIGTIAGCIVRSGNMNRKGRMRVIRDGVEIYDGGIASLRRFKDDVNEVKEGYECGIGIENFNDVKIGDVFECYRTEEVARTLDQAAKS
ncbi:translation initiation factor IF-2 [Gemmatimonas groenlandica]|uniref:Translation initiation factor IF-2 n=1 Tax=Gemmatimonas groenlandica TaxID=2732249 RepID=A0A6M4IQM4_9BACT|nr:translation initiation factor IF-2 [Gemmatimonas groenlandica]QJR35142.1 translation initiation factor IF-2 [Gemmatimonas groenlandica]